jgi:hypothetical protein
VERWQEIRPGDPGGAPAVLGAVAWGFFHPQLVAVRDARRLVTLDVERARIDLCGGDEDPTRVWWPADTTAEVVGAGDRAVEAAYRLLVEQAVTVLGPLVELIRSQVSIGRRGLWAHVVDTFNGVGPRYTDPAPDRLCAELGLMERARAGTPLAQRAVVVDIDRPDGCRRVVRTSACCLAYLAPHHPGDRSLPWSEGPWADYCMRCPLIPLEETVRRADHWLDHDGV